METTKQREEKLKNRIDMITHILTDKRQTYEEKLKNINIISGYLIPF